MADNWQQLCGKCAAIKGVLCEYCRRRCSDSSECSRAGYHSVEEWSRTTEQLSLDLEAGVPIYDGIIPFIFWACRKNHLHVVRVLVNAGASLFCKSDVEQMPELRHGECTCPLGSHSRLLVEMGDTPLHVACRGPKKRGLDLAKFILRHSDGIATINEVNGDGYRPLDVAAADGNISLMHLLLEHGADERGCDKYVPSIRGLVLLVQWRKLIRTGEWRPWKHTDFPEGIKITMCTLLLLAKAHVS